MLDDILDELTSLLDAARGCGADVAAAAHLVADRLGRGGKVLVVGNGGSAAAASHLASELVGDFEDHRRALPAVALVGDGATLTALGNDFGFAAVFERQIEALAGPDDVVVALSTSGTSPNVVAAVGAAQRRGVAVVALTGADPRDLGGADVVVRAPGARVARVQELHLVLVHAIVARVEAVLGVDGAGREAEA